MLEILITFRRLGFFIPIDRNWLVILIPRGPPCKAGAGGEGHRAGEAWLVPGKRAGLQKLSHDPELTEASGFS